MSYAPKVYRKQGGNEQVVANGGKITLEVGGVIEAGSMQVTRNADGDLVIQDTDGNVLLTFDESDHAVVVEDDNSASFRIKGKDINGNDVQSYFGVFYNEAYDDTGGTGAKKTRLIIGSNADMDLELQGSNHIRITAVDDGTGTGRIRMAAEDQIQMHVGATAETDALVATLTTAGILLAANKALLPSTGTQPSAIADISEVEASMSAAERQAFNDVLAALRGVGIIATV